MSSWLHPLLRGGVPTATVVTSLVPHFFLHPRVADSHPHFSVSSQASYLILHKYEPEDFFAVSGLVLVPPSVVAWICRVVQTQSSPAPTSIFATYLSLLLGYTIIYRVSSFHPLARYPGPFLARVSKLFMVGVVIKGHAHQYYRRLHEKHGDIVRTGARSTGAYR